MQAAIFFDRDGVLNREIGDYITEIDHFEILPDSVASIKLAQEHGFKVIVITNQGGIDKELYSIEQLDSFHAKLQAACIENGTKIDDFYFCRHHPLKGKCFCRKPDSLMLEKAMAKHRISKDKSLMIGDTVRDMEAARKVGVLGLLIQPNSPKLRLLETEILKIKNKN